MRTQDMNVLKNKLHGRRAKTLFDSGWSMAEASEAADIVLDVVFGEPLIAAAPDLLKACEAAYHALLIGVGEGEAQQLCSAAIAQAKGGGE